MAFSRADFVQETTATTGTGSYSLGGATDGHQGFLAGNSSGDTVRYSVSNGIDWEVGEGVVTSGSLTRATILGSSNSGSAVSWGSGEKKVSQVLTSAEVDALATQGYVDSAVAGIVSAAPSTLDTLDELAAALGDDANFASTTATSLGQKLVKTSNLSDLTSASSARSNLGLGTAATTSATDYATAAQGALADSALQGNQTISLSGDASGSGTTSITVTVADNSHAHTIANVTGLQSALDDKTESEVTTSTPTDATGKPAGYIWFVV